MTRNNWMWITLTIVILFALQAPATATVTIIEVPAPGQSIVGITGFTTTESDMVGMKVTAFFGSLAPIVADWDDLGMGVFGAQGFAIDNSNPMDPDTYAFKLTQSGDTFTSSWTLEHTSDVDFEPQLTGIRLDGVNGGTIFDRTYDTPPGDGVDDEGTPGSALGTDFGTSSTLNILASYINRVNIDGFGPVGDVFASLDIAFEGGLFVGERLTFVADTDSIGLPPGQTPEPSMILLLGVGLVALYRRNRN